jgi:hypothetical protein
MDLPFTHKPGRRERHLRRRHENPLFALPPREVAPEDLLAAQKADHEEMEAFRDAFAGLVREAAELPPDVGSERVLALKESLERHFEQACGLPGDHSREKDAIRRLIDVIMRSIRRQAGSDPLARQELGDEEAAREIHFRLLEQPLAADILHPESPIGPDELAPALLHAAPAEIAAVCEIFDAGQLALVIGQGETLCERVAEAGFEAGRARAALERLRAATGGSPDTAGPTQFPD